MRIRFGKCHGVNAGDGRQTSALVAFRPRKVYFMKSSMCTLFAIVGCWHSVCSLAKADDAQVDFDQDIRPILMQCIRCHGPGKQEGGMRFDGRDVAFQAGDSGNKAIEPKDIAHSELIRRVESKDDSQRMPPEGATLSHRQIEILRTWIDQGANWPEASKITSSVPGEMVVTEEDRQHWSYRPLGVTQPPTVKDNQWCQTPIDQFILAKLDSSKLTPNQRADRRTLIRRLYFDLIGLPPTPEEVEAFVSNPSSSAVEELIDKLLDSSHYGERWGRHWLDLTRYADSNGLETDADRPTAWHFRDFVIRAFNDDLSYQTFVRWQLAGDEYEPDAPEARAATGFLVTAPNETLGPNFIEEERLRLRYNELDDTAVTTTAAFLGLTLGCARCHDHKFDAIPTRDYYRIQAAFIGTARGEVFLASRDAISKYHHEEKAWNQRMKPIQDRFNHWLDEQRKPHESKLRHQKIDGLSISPEEKTVLKEQPDSEPGKRLSQQHEQKLKLTDDDYRRVFTKEQRDTWDAMAHELEEVNRTRPQAPPTGLAITEPNGDPQEAWLLSRGDFYSKQERVELGFLTVLTGNRSPEQYRAAALKETPSVSSSHQRRALAEWMTDVDQGAGALLARVFINRVWQHHFGEGLSRTVNDFGVRAENPSHPELLDWLAQDFITHGWRLKRLQKLILMSAVYQQDTTFDTSRASIDPENRLLWRRRPLRLESEILRDSVLAVSGTLNAEPFGPAFKPPIPPEAMLARNTGNPYPRDASDSPVTRRRSVYMFHKRVVQYPLMQVFDAPDASVSCGRRNNTTVAPQALALLNDPFLRDRATDFAKRLISEKGANRSDWVTRSFQLALSRPPNERELNTSLEFIDKQTIGRSKRQPNSSADETQHQALADLCQSLFSLSEFIYVD